MFDMRRRDFVALLGGAAASLPLAARAQQGEGMRRIGVLMASAADDSENQARMAAFLQGLAQWGWTDGRNIRIDTRWATTNPDDLRRHATELAALATSWSLRVAPQPWRRCCRRPAPCRSCSWLSSTRSAPVSSRA
jgi:putative ABC transport system substrate-binding protein